jgi:regulatory protein
LAGAEGSEQEEAALSHLMPVITKISEQKRRSNRRNVFLDGVFAFGCNLNVVAKFRLREGMNLSEPQVREIEHGELRQECFDRAMSAIASRPQSREGLRRKLVRREFGQSVIDAVLDDLIRLGYVNDERFARGKATSSAKQKRHGRRRALVDLRRAGVSGTVAQKALDDVYSNHDAVASARIVAEKQAPRLKKLDIAVARRRLVGMLQRRGFDYDAIKPAVEGVLGRG